MPLLDTPRSVAAFIPSPRPTNAIVEKAAVASPAPIASTGTDGASKSIPNIAWVALIVGGVVVCVYIFQRLRALARISEDEKDGSNLSALGCIVAAVSGFAALARAVIVPANQQSPWVPNLDAITLSWAGLAALGMLLPLMSEISVGTVSLKLREIATKLLDETAYVVKYWAIALNQYLADAENAAKDQWQQRLDQFIFLRLSEAVEWIGTPDDIPRLSVWIANKESRRLEYMWGIGFSEEPVGESFAYDEGVIGAAFTEHIGRDQIDPSTLPIWIQRAPYVYKSLLVVPIDFGSQQLGVLCIDRLRKEYWEEEAESVMDGLAAILGMAIGTAEIVSKRER